MQKPGSARIDPGQGRPTGILIALLVTFVVVALLNELGRVSLIDDTAPRIREWTDNPQIRTVVHPLTRIGAWPGSIAIGVTLAWLRARRLAWGRASAPVAAIVISMVVEAALRLDFPHATVSNVWAALTESSTGEGIRSSFPSGHMTRITVLAAFALPLLVTSRISARLLFVAVIVAMAINRLQFSGHTVSDLVGGLLLGAIVAWLTPPLIRRIGSLR